MIDFMQVSWHCRRCNEQGTQEVSLDLLTKKHEELKQNVIDVLIALIEHECENRDIGIKLGENSWA